MKKCETGIREKETYQSPAVETVAVNVERGFAGSGGEIGDSDGENFGNGGRW